MSESIFLYTLTFPSICVFFNFYTFTCIKVAYLFACIPKCSTPFSQKKVGMFVFTLQDPSTSVTAFPAAGSQMLPLISYPRECQRLIAAPGESDPESSRTHMTLLFSGQRSRCDALCRSLWHTPVNRSTGCMCAALPHYICPLAPAHHPDPPNALVLHSTKTLLLFAYSGVFAGRHDVFLSGG